MILVTASVPTIGEQIAQGFTNMLVGLFVVFTVLIFLTLIIYCFRFLGKVGNAPAQAPKAAPAAAPAPGVASAATFAEEVPAGPGTMAAAKVDFGDEVDGETAAVILGAVASECGGDFRVVSIKKSK